MPEYISREAALDSICTACEAVPIDEKENCPYKFTGCEYGSVFAIPAADVVEVVRCRECFYNRGETKDLWGNPAIKCVTAVTHEPDWYCASGKRKDGGQDDV